MSTKKAIKSLTILEEQLAALKETTNVERLAVLGLEEVLTKIKFVHPEVQTLIELASEQLNKDLQGQLYLKNKIIDQADKQKEIAILHANKKYEDNLRRVRKILIQNVFHKIHNLKASSAKPPQVPLSKRIDRMRLMHRLSSKHVMPVLHSHSSSAELDFDLSVIRRKNVETPLHLQNIPDPNGILIYFVPEYHLIRYVGKTIKAGDNFYLIMNHKRILANLQQVRSREVISVMLTNSNEEKVFTVNDIRSAKIKMDPIELSEDIDHKQ